MAIDTDIALLAGSVQRALDGHINRNTVGESRDIDRLNNPTNRLDFRRWLTRDGNGHGHMPSPYQQPFQQPPQSQPQYYDHQYGHEEVPRPQSQDSFVSQPLPNTPQGFIPTAGIKDHLHKYVNPSNSAVIETNNNTSNFSSPNLSFQNTEFSKPNLEAILEAKSEETIIESLRRDVFKLKEINEKLDKKVTTLNNRILKLIKMLENEQAEQVPS